MNRHVIGLFSDLSEAEAAIEPLVAAGVERGEISILSSRGENRPFELVESTQLSEETAAAVAVGGVLGSGVSAVAIGTSGGTILAVGPLLIALASLGVGTAVGGIVGALVGVGIPEHEGRFYEREIVDGKAVLVGVATLRHRDGRIASILLRNGANNITRSA